MKARRHTNRPLISADATRNASAKVVDFMAFKVERVRRATAAHVSSLPLPEPPPLARVLWGDLRMHLTDAALIAEAVACNHKQIKRRQTINEYETILRHWSAFCSAHETDFYGAQRKHVLLFLGHLEEPDGEVAARCPLCAERGFPHGRKRKSFSASYRKKHLAALRFLYWHFRCDETLPDLDPAAAVKAPTVPNEHQYTPSEDEVRALLAARGNPRDRLLAHLLYYAPTRRDPVTRMRWSDVDLARGVWSLIGKGDKVDEFLLHPVLLSELRRYRAWQAREAEHNAAVARALADPETAHVFLTRTGKPVRGESLAKMLKWRAIRAGVAVMETDVTWDAPGGLTSRMCPHALRRAWATHAHADAVSVDTISEVLRHADPRTTRRHYIRSKPERAQQALMSRSL